MTDSILNVNGIPYVHRPRCALVTGATGQTASYLCELLLEKGYELHAIMRRASTFTTDRVEHIRERITFHYGDILDASIVSRIVAEVQPDEVYHLAAQSHVAVSFQEPVYTVESIVLGTLNMLEACRGRNIRFYQASSSEQWGSSPPPQHELTPMVPQSPYAIAKVAAHQLTVNHREQHGMFNCCGILHNHESSRRGETFVTRKITRAATRIKLGLQNELVLGNLDAKRDWGFAGDYVQAMWLMLQQDKPDDYVIATGESHSVREFLEAVFAHPKVNLDWHDWVRFDEKYLRPREVNYLLGDASKAKRVLGWEPTVKFAELVNMMVESDLELAKAEAVKGMFSLVEA